MPNLKRVSVTRRQLGKNIVAGAAVLAAPYIAPGLARAKTSTLRILRWKNFVAASETWFNDIFIKQWSEQTGINVGITNVGLGEINKVAEAEAQAGAGHDLVLFVGPRAALEDHVIDHREVIEECEQRFGSTSEAVHKSCFNPRTNKFHGFPESVFPTMVTYRQDLWDAVGKHPSSWDDVRKGGRAIKLLHGSPSGFSFAPEHNAEHTLRVLLNSFGGFLQNEDNQLAIDGPGTLEALKFAKTLYEETMTKDVLSWSPASNNQFMLAGAGNLTIDTMSIIRAAEVRQLEVNSKLNLALLPEGPHGRLGPMFGLNTFVIWKFAENAENAKQFLIDYIGRFHESSLAGGFQNIAVYPRAVKQLAEFTAQEQAHPGRYDALLHVFETMTNLGYPGTSNAAIDEVMAAGVVPGMFSAVVTGAMTPQDAIAKAAAQADPIFQKWRAAGKV